MKVLVVGGTGFVGTHLGRLLVEHGHPTTLVGLSAGGRPAGARAIECDRQAAAFGELLAREEADAVVDLIAYREEETRAIVRRLAGRVGRFVHLSTLSVFAAAHALQVTEENAVRSGPRRSYGEGKGRCEMVLEDAFRQDGFPCVILRSAPLMGPGDSASRENYFLKRLRAGRPIFVPGEPGGHLTTLYVEDLARVILEALCRPHAVGRDYNLAQAERITLEEHVWRIAQLTGTRPRIVWTDADALAGAARNPFAFPYAPLEFSAWVETSRARRELGFEPTAYPVALERTVDWLLQQRSWPAWPGNGSVQCGLAGTHEWLETDAERWREGGVAPPPLDEEWGPDEVLQELCQAHEPQSATCTFVPRSWAERLNDCASGLPATVATAALRVILPDELHRWLRPAHGFDAHDQGGVAAVFETTAGDPRAYRLFTQAGARRSRGYGFHNLPPVIRFAPLSELDLAFDVKEGEREVVRVVDDECEQALRRWLDECDADGRCRVGSVQRCSRVFLVDSERLSRTHGCWCLVFDACRLLRRGSALDGDGPFDLELSGGGRRLFPALGRLASRRGEPLPSVRGRVHLLRVAGRYFAFRVAPAALLELTMAVAVLLEALAVCGDDEEPVTLAVATTLGVPPERAATLYGRGLELLAHAGLEVRNRATPNSLAAPAHRS